jgi:hypothetical protein
VLTTARTQEALDHAVAAFPALARFARERISLHVAGRSEPVRVPAVAWVRVLRDLPQYEVVVLEVEDDSPPEYRPSKEAAPRAKRGVFGWVRGLFGKA